MGKNIYKEIPIFIFNEVVKNNPIMEENREVTIEYLNHFINGHLNFIEKYGNSYLSNILYIKELSVFFKAIYQIELEEVKKIITNFLRYSSLECLPDDEKEVNECIVAYPTYKHIVKEDDLIKHHPIVNIYVFNKKSYLKINPDAINNLASNIEEFTNFLIFSSIEVSIYWTKDKVIADKEKALIAADILNALKLNNGPIFKENIIKF